jgi:hypothetical protein
MTWPIGFSSLIGCSFILEGTVIPESAKDSVRYHVDRAGPYSAGAGATCLGSPEGTSGKQPWRLVGYFERFT